MNASPFVQLGLYLVALFAIAWLLGRYLTAVMDGQLSAHYGWLGAFERAICRLIGTSVDEDMPWWRYAMAIVLFNLLGMIAVYVLQRLQGGLPLNPAGMTGVEAGSAFNTAVSFTTNTNWQGYGGESTMSYLTQMLALVRKHEIRWTREHSN
ncbi:potassium-transporting ATPase subunit KdpA [Cupriavidus necator]